MFPADMVAEMRMYQESLLRSAGYEPERRQPSGGWIIDRRLRLNRFLVQAVVSLLAALGL
jgi:hypothetical protein